MVEMKASVVPTRVMTDPVPILMHMGRFGVTRLIGEVSIFFYRMRGTRRFVSVRWRGRHRALAVSSAVLAMLRKGEETEH